MEQRVSNCRHLEQQELRFVVMATTHNPFQSHPTVLWVTARTVARLWVTSDGRLPGLGAAEWGRGV